MRQNDLQINDLDSYNIFDGVRKRTPFCVPKMAWLFTVLLLHTTIALECLQYGLVTGMETIGAALYWLRRQMTSFVSEADANEKA